MNKKGLLGALALSAVLGLAGCSGGADAGSSSLAALQEKHPEIIENEGEARDGGVLKVAIVSDSGFKGIFNPVLYTDGLDNSVMGDTMCGAMPTTPDFRLRMDDPETPLNMHLDKDEKTVTYHINPKFKWNDGTTVSPEDIIKTYEIVANQEYIEASQSPRFGQDMYIIEGIKDYNEGKADHISGLEKVDDSTLKIHFSEITPSVIYGGATLGEFVKASDFEGVAMKDILSSDAIVKNPASYGPFVIKEITPGQRVLLEPNEYYYKGKAKLDAVEYEILPTSQQVADMQSGGHDIYLDASSDTYSQMAELQNVKIAVRPELYMSFMGFKLGKWDAAKNTVVVNPDAKMANVALRQAMGYAIDNDAIGEHYYNGLRFTAESPIAPVFTKFHDPNSKGYHFDMEKAKKLLDDAGYKDVDGDGFREDPNGKPLQINLAMMAGGETAEPLSQYYLQMWGKGEDGTGENGLGLNVQLVDGRLLEFKNFYERVQNDDPDIDVFMAAFGLASDPNPSGLYGAHEGFNLSRYTSPKMEEVLGKIGSAEALDEDKAVEFYREFEKTVMDEAPIVPMQNKVELVVVNNRVKHYDFSREDHGFDLSKLQLTADNPLA